MRSRTRPSRTGSLRRRWPASRERSSAASRSGSRPPDAGGCFCFTPLGVPDGRAASPDPSGFHRRQARFPLWVRRPTAALAERRPGWRQRPPDRFKGARGWASGMQAGLMDFGIAERPSCRCQRSITCAADHWRPGLGCDALVLAVTEVSASPHWRTTFGVRCCGQTSRSMRPRTRAATQSSAPSNCWAP